jgi:hypothetical protein
LLLAAGAMLPVLAFAMLISVIMVKAGQRDRRARRARRQFRIAVGCRRGPGTAVDLMAHAFDVFVQGAWVARRAASALA